MDNKSTAIEFRSMPFHSDLDDLSQECTAYMKTKQFMAKRIHEQQEEIEILKQNVIYLSGKLFQAEEMVLHMSDQVKLLKESSKIQKPQEEFDLSNSELASSFIYENCEENNDPKITPKFFEELKKENFELRKDLENYRIQILDSTIQLNKTKSDKFILFNELNEMLMSLKKVDLEKLNSFYKINSDKILNKNEMPIAKGIKYNILSAQSQLCKMMVTDSITKKLNINDNEESSRGDKLFDKNQIEISQKILKKNEEDFDRLLDRKLAKRTTGIILY
jgi:hypothetical protein